MILIRHSSTRCEFSLPERMPRLQCFHSSLMNDDLHTLQRVSLFLKTKLTLSANYLQKGLMSLADSFTNHSSHFLLTGLTLNIDDIPREETVAVLDKFHFSEHVIATLTTCLFTTSCTETLSALLNTSIVENGICSAIIDRSTSIDELRAGQFERFGRLNETSILVHVGIEFFADVRKLARPQSTDL